MAGVLARAVGSEATVTLRAPIPLELTSRSDGMHSADGAPGARRAELRHEGRLLAEAVAAAPDLPPPPPPVPDRSTALAASERYAGRTPNPYQECFVCGFAREPGAGLRVFAGPTPTPDSSPRTGRSTRDSGTRTARCPASSCGEPSTAPAPTRPGPGPRISGSGGWPPASRAASGRESAARWPAGVSARERRKHFTGTAVYGEAGQVVALASAVWIAPRAGGPDS